MCESGGAKGRVKGYTTSWSEGKAEGKLASDCAKVSVPALLTLMTGMIIDRVHE